MPGATVGAVKSIIGAAGLGAGMRAAGFGDEAGFRITAGLRARAAFFAAARFLGAAFRAIFFVFLPARFAALPRPRPAFFERPVFFAMGTSEYRRATRAPKSRCIVPQSRRAWCAPRDVELAAWTRTPLAAAAVARLDLATTLTCHFVVGGRCLCVCPTLSAPVGRIGNGIAGHVGNF
jgi:hypothetical protein